MNNVELKEFFDSRLNSIDREIKNNHDHAVQYLQSIEAQTTKTNGRVSALEVRVWQVEKEESSHVVNCPNSDKIIELFEETAELRMIKKYPRLALIVLVIFIGSLVGSVAYGLLEMHNIMQVIKTEQKK